MTILWPTLAVALGSKLSVAITGSGGVLKSHNSLAKVNRDDNGRQDLQMVSLNLIKFSGSIEALHLRPE